MNNKEVAYDIEVFPDFFSVVFFNLNSSDDLESISKGNGLSHKDVSTFFFSEHSSPEEKETCLKGINEFILDKPTLVGFNNLMYDNPVMDYILFHNPTNYEIFEFSSSLIARMNGGGFNNYQQNNNWKSIDLMKVMAFDSLGVSLKQSSINLQWWRVQDLPLPFDKKIGLDNIKKVLEYNLNDVLITASLYKGIEKELNLRRDLSKEYGIDLMSASDSKMANLMLEDIYVKETGIPLEQLQHLRTQRELVWLRQCVGKGISFKTKTLRKLKQKIDNTVVVSENNFSFKERVSFGGTDYEIGVGGLHSVDTPNEFCTTDTHIIQDADVASYYPNIIINNGTTPKHLGENFVKILDKITKQRVKAKKTDPVKAAGLKITINSIFGKLNSDTFWLQDAKALLSVTLSGQLYLLMLIEELHIHGIPTISANTDGIVCRIPVELEDTYYEICHWWEDTTEFELEYTPYQRYIRSDVNNYITVKPDGKTKEKGRFTKKIGLKKGYKHPIIPKTIYEYLINEKPIMDTLLEANNIMDFCISQKSGRKFQIEFHKDETVEVLQKNNRFYVAKSGGNLLKRNKTNKNKTIGIMASEEVNVVNDIDKNVPIKDYGINYLWYYNEVMKYISPIEKSSFDITFYPEEIDTEKEVVLLDINPNAKIVPAKFRFSGGAYNYNDKNGNIYRGVAPINFLTNDTGETLYSLRDEVYNGWVDFLIDVVESKLLNSRQLKSLINIDFFSEFGERRKLLEFYLGYFTKGKYRYNKNHKEKTKLERIPELLRQFDELVVEKYKPSDIIKIETDVLGFVQTLFPQYNNKVRLVTSLDIGEFSPKIELYVVSEGRTSKAKVSKALFKRKKFKYGDVLEILKFERKNKTFKDDDGKWIDVPNKYVFWIRDYRIIKKGVL